MTEEERQRVHEPEVQHDGTKHVDGDTGSSNTDYYTDLQDMDKRQTGLYDDTVSPKNSLLKPLSPKPLSPKDPPIPADQSNSSQRVPDTYSNTTKAEKGAKF